MNSRVLTPMTSVALQLLVDPPKMNRITLPQLTSGLAISHPLAWTVAQLTR